MGSFIIKKQIYLQLLDDQLNYYPVDGFGSVLELYIYILRIKTKRTLKAVLTEVLREESEIQSFQRKQV